MAVDTDRRDAGDAIADVFAELERRQQADAVDRALGDDAALRTALLQRDRDALRTRLEALSATLNLPAEHLQLRCTFHLVADVAQRMGLDWGPGLDWRYLATAGRAFFEELAFKCVEYDAWFRGQLCEQSMAEDPDAPRRPH